MEKTVDITQKDWTDLIKNTAVTAETVKRIENNWNEHVEEHKTIANNCSVHNSIITRLNKDMYEEKGLMDRVWNELAKYEKSFIKTVITLSILLLGALGTVVWFLISELTKKAMIK